MKKPFHELGTCVLTLGNLNSSPQPLRTKTHHHIFLWHWDHLCLANWLSNESFMGNDRLLYWYLYDIDVNLSTPQILPKKCFVVLSKASLQLSDHRLNSLWMCSIVAFTRYSLVDYNKEYFIIYRKNYFAKQNDFSHRLPFVFEALLYGTYVPM